MKKGSVMGRSSRKNNNNGRRRDNIMRDPEGE